MRAVESACDFDNIKTRVYSVMQTVFNEVVLGGTAYTLLLLFADCFATAAICIRNAKFDFDEMIDRFRCAINLFVFDCDYINLAMFVAIVVFDKLEPIVHQKNAGDTLACAAFSFIKAGRQG